MLQLPWLAMPKLSVRDRVLDFVTDQKRRTAQAAARGQLATQWPEDIPLPDVALTDPSRRANLVPPATLDSPLLVPRVSLISTSTANRPTLIAKPPLPKTADQELDDEKTEREERLATRRDRRRARRQILHPSTTEGKRKKGSIDDNELTDEDARPTKKSKNSKNKPAPSLPPGLALMQNFSSANVATGRLTLANLKQPALGVFAKGKASARMKTNEKSGKIRNKNSTSRVPVFDEHAFLTASPGHQIQFTKLTTRGTTHQQTPAPSATAQAPETISVDKELLAGTKSFPHAQDDIPSSTPNESIPHEPSTQLLEPFQPIVASPKVKVAQPQALKAVSHTPKPDVASTQFTAASQPTPGPSDLLCSDYFESIVDADLTDRMLDSLDHLLDYTSGRHFAHPATFALSDEPIEDELSLGDDELDFMDDIMFEQAFAFDNRIQPGFANDTSVMANVYDESEPQPSSKYHGHFSRRSSAIYDTYGDYVGDAEESEASCARDDFVIETECGHSAHSIGQAPSCGWPNEMAEENSELEDNDDEAGWREFAEGRTLLLLGSVRRPKLAQIEDDIKFDWSPYNRG
ncbi:hypothetical protein BKA62DRAFT_771403 [Auriculariales sp. MPI-PUGE-AT-0066]|nr:hypothetical protein BKA62DRAFT_771403 [Auriculariales sp. MPI-PUGE-AT-0066]